MFTKLLDNNDSWIHSHTKPVMWSLGSGLTPDNRNGDIQREFRVPAKHWHHKHPLKDSHEITPTSSTAWGSREEPDPSYLLFAPTPYLISAWTGWGKYGIRDKKRLHGLLTYISKICGLFVGMDFESTRSKSTEGSEFYIVKVLVECLSSVCALRHLAVALKALKFG